MEYYKHLMLIEGACWRCLLDKIGSGVLHTADNSCPTVLVDSTEHDYYDFYIHRLAIVMSWIDENQCDLLHSPIYATSPIRVDGTKRRTLSDVNFYCTTSFIYFSILVHMTQTLRASHSSSSNDIWVTMIPKGAAQITLHKPTAQCTHSETLDWRSHCCMEQRASEVSHRFQHHQRFIFIEPMAFAVVEAFELVRTSAQRATVLFARRQPYLDPLSAAIRIGNTAYLRSASIPQVTSLIRASDFR